MNKYIIAGLLSAVSLSSFSNTTYIGLDYSLLNAELSEQGAREDSNPSAINVKVGSQLNDHFAVELLLGTGIDEDSVENTRFELELDSLRNLSFIGILPMQSFSLYGKLGYAEVEYDDSEGDSADASGMTVGAGVGFNITEHTGISVEYVKYPDGDYDGFETDIDVAAFNLGVYYKF